MTFEELPVGHMFVLMNTEPQVYRKYIKISETECVPVMQFLDMKVEVVQVQNNSVIGPIR